MTKISMETKIQAVEDYLLGSESKLAITNRYGIARKLFDILVAIYEQHGRNGLLNPPSITGQLRVSLVQWKQTNHASMVETCAQFDVLSVEAIVRWERIYNLYGKQPLLEMRPGVKPHRKRIRSGQDQAPGTRELILADTRRRLKKLHALRQQPRKKSVKSSSNSGQNTD
jgi:hypothetical protein